MKPSYPAWYALLAVFVLVPLGVRVLTWPVPRAHPPQASMEQAGHMLFTHEWTPHDPLCPNGDGLGPVYNATSCVACHRQGGVGGSGGLEHNVTTFVVRSQTGAGRQREGVVHAYAVQYQETLQDVNSCLPQLVRPSLDKLITVSFPEGGRPSTQAALAFPAGVHVSQRNTPALFGAKWIDEISDRDIIAGERRQRLKWGLAPADGENAPVGRALRLADGRIGRFGWKAQSANLAEFVQAACANELGLSNPGQTQPRPLGKPDYQFVGLDLTAQQCDQLTAFVASLPRPVEREPVSAELRQRVAAGKQLFHGIGCADCHTPDLGSVSGLYSDLLLHRMGEQLEGIGSYNRPPPQEPDRSPGDGPLPDEWRTPPLWGIADSGPYLHDGRAATLEQAIQFHAGQAERAAERFNALGPGERTQLIAFLKSLRAP
jgi:CxxC motif-containing protein (DUF1111 family)